MMSAVATRGALCGAHWPKLSPISLGHLSRLFSNVNVTYEWQSAIVAGGNLRLVRVDKDARVSSRATATIAGYHAVVRPANGLLVDELYGGVARRL